eukprot:9035406-Pyramimonas_sp.AAC.1
MSRRTVDRAKSEELSNRASGTRGGTTVGAPAQASTAALLKLEHKLAQAQHHREWQARNLNTGTHVASPRAQK